MNRNPAARRTDSRVRHDQSDRPPDRSSDVSILTSRRSSIDRATEKSPAESQRLSRDTSKPDVDQVVTRLFPLARLSITQSLAAIWLGGTLGYLLLVGVRAVRFSRALRIGRREVPAAVRAEAASVAALLGLKRSPRLAMIAAPLPPLVWPGWRPTVLLPQALVESLGVAQRRLLLLHEFVHIRRLDHRVRWFQIGVVALYWWNPIAWWAARRLERAEEECCDAAVLRLAPNQAAGYGQTLVAVTEFLSTGKLPAPALSIGIVRENHLKRRLHMILNGPRWPRLSKTRLVAFAIVGASLIAVTWTVATAQNADVPAIQPPVDSATTPSSLKSPVEERRLAAIRKLQEIKPEPGDGEMQKLMNERYNAALHSVRLYQTQFDNNTVRAHLVAAALHDLCEAELALVKRPADQVRILEKHLEECTKLWKQTYAKLVAGGVTGFTPVDESDTRAARYEAEIRLLKFRETETKKSSLSAGAPVAPELPAPSLAGNARNPFSGPKDPNSARKFLLDLMNHQRIEVRGSDGEARNRLTERYNAAVQAMEVYRNKWRTGRLDLVKECDGFFNAGRDLFAAEWVLAQPPYAGQIFTPENRLAILETYLDFIRYFEQATDEWIKAGGVAGIDAPAAASRFREARLTAEAEVRKQRRELRERELHNPPAFLQTEASGSEPLTEALTQPPPQAVDARDALAPSPRPVPAGTTAPSSARLPATASSSDPAGRLLPFELQTPPGGESEERKRLRARYETARGKMQTDVDQFNAGAITGRRLLDAAHELADTGVALATGPEEKLRVAIWYHTVALKTWREIETKFTAGGETKENHDDEAAAWQATLDAKAMIDEATKSLPALLTAKMIEPRRMMTTVASCSNRDTTPLSRLCGPSIAVAKPIRR